MKKIQQIALLVTLSHFLVLLSLSLRNPPPPKPTRITVHTLARAPIAIAPPPAPSKKSAPKKTAAKNPSPSKPAPKSASATPSPHPKKNAQEVSRDLDPPTPSTHKPALTLPTLVIPKTLTVEAAPDDTTSDPTYAELLISYLQQTLELPEYGPVKMRLSFNAEGRLTHSEVIESKQHKNSEFLQQRLAELVFPSPPNHESTILTITFRN